MSHFNAYHYVIYSQTHFYQPLWTLVGGGLKTFEETVRPTKDVLPKKCDWIKAKVVNFDPDNNTVTTSDGQKVCINQTGITGTLAGITFFQKMIFLVNIRM